jgi:hypothetical protein
LEEEEEEDAIFEVRGLEVFSEEEEAEPVELAAPSLARFEGAHMDSAMVKWS